MTEQGWPPPHAWLAELAAELRRRALAPALTAQVVAEAQAHLRDSGQLPERAFGTAAGYAAAIAASLTESLAESRAESGPTDLSGWPTMELATVTGPVRRTAGDETSLAPARSPAPAAADQPVLLAARGISKRFGRRRVLDNIDLSVRAGQVAAVVGANGCGKSTLLRICAGLTTPDSGTVQVRGALGFCPQDGGTSDFLLPEEHFTLVGAGRGLNRAGSAAAGRTAAHGLDWDPTGAPAARHLSGGTRQKLNLVLAGIGDPDVLLLDEPYQGFDQGSYLDFWQQVWQWRGAGKAVVVVTHLLSQLDRVDIVLDLSADRRAVA
jgi:ABC-2 type transport system ATP-binding protein